MNERELESNLEMLAICVFAACALVGLCTSANAVMDSPETTARKAFGLGEAMFAEAEEIERKREALKK